MGDREVTRRLAKGSDRTLAGFLFFLGLFTLWAGFRQSAWWAVVGGIPMMIGSGILWWVAGWRPSYPGRGEDMTQFRRAAYYTLVSVGFTVAGIAIVIIGEKLRHSR